MVPRTPERGLCEKARQAWIKKLIDLSRRNNLLYYRSLKWGTLGLCLDDTERWGALLGGDTVPLKSLVERISDEDLIQKVVAIWRSALANQEEKGLATLFIALGDGDMEGIRRWAGFRITDSSLACTPVRATRIFSGV